MISSPQEERKAKTLQRALDEIADLDLEGQGRKGGFTCKALADGRQQISIPSFGDTLSIFFPQGDIEFPAFIDSFSLQVLALRYIKLSCDKPITGEWIAYRDLPGGRFYAATLVPTVEQPLAQAFGTSPGLLAKAAAGFGGLKVDYGDEAYVFYPFPRTPLLSVLHWGDEEFEPDCRILFDRCCSHYLNTDDLKILATQLSAYLLKWSGAQVQIENLLWMVE
ncbi:MAG: hypothetical protein A2W01_07130 [Candidatus Solincola sediminis]|uniref:DUF3786 domain-containing protein n=1 Tax=Candidatus Solincola sediminis TaxID=1797199 RepID=A0A1F2WRK4_9ACTN|nr:MAG: hypothetical protein A2Y75_11390 [Candidatus Solincola sediminis]OFW59903.1 MAG: hypothetical protein A2W01_07130 [Candidatus Solincola sediminis]